MRDLTLSLIQTPLQWHAPAENRRRLEALMDTAGQDSELLVLPEMFTTGFTMAAGEQAETMDGVSVQWMRDQARHRNKTITGSLIIKSGDAYFNRLIWMPPDGQSGHYDKRHLFRMAGEDKVFSAGTQRPVFQLGAWRVFPLICYDLRFPVWSRGADEFDLLIYVANWPQSRRSAWQTLLPARAVENLCYVAAVNRVGRDGKDIDYCGDSGVWDYLGTRLANAEDKPAVLDVRLDSAALQRYREKFPAHRDADAFTLDDLG